MSRAEKYLPFILAVFIPAMSAINNADGSNEASWFITMFRYFEASLVLLVIWFFNKWLLYSNNTFERLVGRQMSIVIANPLVIACIALVDLLFIPIGFNSIIPFWVLLIRFSLGVLLFNVILRIFKSQKESNALKFQNLSLQAENLKFQIETFKQQINPHFLFNSLNTLLDLIEEDKDGAVTYVRNFSNLYRTVLQSAKRDFIPLSDELKFLDDYWNLLKVRFNDTINLNIQLENQKMDYLIPPLSLQFLIENAVKHNDANKKTPLLIEIYQVDDSLNVKNKVNLKKFPAASEKLGLKNLQQRFTLLHQPIQYGMQENVFVVTLPLKTT